jgi:hypothetical protein
MFPWLRFYINFEKNAWATFWAIFLQSHLVTLVAAKEPVDAFKYMAIMHSFHL